jgi:hypothetical protein
VTCTYCRDALEGAAPVCARAGCGALYHVECWEECHARYGGCAVYGCGSTEAAGELSLAELLRESASAARRLTIDPDDLFALTHPRLAFGSFFAALPLQLLGLFLFYPALELLIPGAGSWLGLFPAGLACVLGLVLLEAFGIPFAAAFVLAIAFTRISHGRASV